MEALINYAEQQMQALYGFVVHRPVIMGFDLSVPIMPSEAEAKAEALLAAAMTPDQKREWKQGRHTARQFSVIGSHSNARYVLHYTSVYGVELCGAAPSVWLCFQPAGVSTMGDLLLAQKITLETDEPAAYAVANIKGQVPAFARKWVQRKSQDDRVWFDEAVHLGLGGWLTPNHLADAMRYSFVEAPLRSGGLASLLRDEPAPVPSFSGETPLRGTPEAPDWVEPRRPDMRERLRECVARWRERAGFGGAANG